MRKVETLLIVKRGTWARDFGPSDLDPDIRRFGDSELIYVIDRLGREHNFRYLGTYTEAHGGALFQRDVEVG